MNPVVHFEMPAEDRKRMAEFYTKVFGWKTEQLGEMSRSIRRIWRTPVARCSENRWIFQA